MASPVPVRSMNAMLVLLILVAIGLQTSILMWIRKLERTGCECSKDWRRDYIQFYCIFAILLGGLAIVGILSGNDWMLQTGAWIKTVLAILFVVFGLQYVIRLKKEKCECSEDTRREILFIWNIISAIFFGLALILSIWIALLVAPVLKK